MLRGKRVQGIERVRYYAGYLLYLVLANRFNAIAGFRGARERLKQSRALRRIALKDGLPASSWFGFPLPRSRLLFHWLQRLYQSRLMHFAEAEATLDDVAAGARGARDTSRTTSRCRMRWPPKKGAFPYSVRSAAGTSRRPRARSTRDSAASWPKAARSPTSSSAIHGVARAAASSSIGWTQMDLYRQPDIARAAGAGPGRAWFAERLSLRADGRLSGATGPARARPLCRIWRGPWRSRINAPSSSAATPSTLNGRSGFYPLHRPPHALSSRPSSTILSAWRIKSGTAELVLSSAGTILLDAVALDTPAVAIALEERARALLRPCGAPLRHGALGGRGRHRRACRWRESLEELTSIIGETLGRSPARREGRRRLRAAHLEPLDGRSAERLVDGIARTVRR